MRYLCFCLLLARTLAVSAQIIVDKGLIIKKETIRISK